MHAIAYKRTSHCILLKRRALDFLACAESDFERGRYSLVLFHVEQFLQLYLEHLLYRKIGDFPKTHSIIRLLKDLGKVYGDSRIDEFYRENLETLYLLEEAYISSRCLPREYDREIAVRILEFSRKALKVVEWLERRS